MKKTLSISLLALSLIFTGCSDENSDEANQYDAEYKIDKKDFSGALAILNDNCGGYEAQECAMLKGAAYLGMSGYDFISIGQDMVTIDGDGTLSPDEKTSEINNVIFKTLFDDNMKTGIEYYKSAFTGDHNATHCNGVDYDTLTTIEKDICLAINPILLQEIVGDDDTQKEQATVDLETIIAFKDVAEAAIPGLTTEELVNVISGGDLGDENDLNINGVPDELDATNCIVQAFNGSDLRTKCGDLSFHNILDTDATINGTTYRKVTMKLTNADLVTKDFYRLVTTGAVKTTVTTTDNNITADGNITTCNYFDEDNCYPEPKKSENNETITLNDTVIDTLNNDTLLSSIAVLSEDDNAPATDQATKVEDLKIDICNEGGTNLCEGSTADGNLTITQDAILDYMSETK